MIYRFIAILAATTIVFIQTAAAQTVDTTHSRTSHVNRNLLIGNLVCGTGAYFYFSETWGAPNGKFHFKNELHDHVAMTDEISHFYAGYKLTEGFRWLFRVFKMPEPLRLRYAAIQSAVVLTFVEIPMDAYNPTQGFGVSDLIFDYGGIGYALLEDKYPTHFDMKFSVKRPPWKFENKFLASENNEFANFIWWTTYTYSAATVGAGYSIDYDDRGEVHSQYYLGIGTTVYDLLHLISPDVADELKSLDSYFFNFRLEL